GAPWDRARGETRHKTRRNQRRLSRTRSAHYRDKTAGGTRQPSHELVGLASAPEKDRSIFLGKRTKPRKGRTLPQRKLSSRGVNCSTIPIAHRRSCSIVGIAVSIDERSIARFEHLSQQLPEMSFELASEVLRGLVGVVSPQNRAVARVERGKERFDQL